MSHVYHSKLGDGRRIAIPADACRDAGIEPGDAVTIEVREDGLRVVPFGQVIKEVQAAFAPYKKAGVSVVDEFVRQRHEQAQRENDITTRRSDDKRRS
jgi:bifunctional DNA-binding transcriptional regulator/antitoxin component of YhaV-PrlF toxin-antitoxin module